MAKRVGSAAAIVAAAFALGAGAAQAQEPAPVAPAPLPPGVVAPGVRIAGVDVGGLARADARAAVLAQVVAPRRAPLVVTFRGRRIAIKPVAVGYRADVDYAVRAALVFGRSRPVPAEGVDVPLRQAVNAKRLRAVLVARAARHELPARDARLVFRGITPVVVKPRVGVAVNVPRSVALVRRAIVERARPVYALAARRMRPAVTSVGPAIIIERARFRLTLWRAGRRETFPIAVGQPAYPTPVGNFKVITKQRNPTWYPPSSPWAAGLGPVPPGVGNPLGTRWMGISSPGIGIHGTPVPSSIGTRASHGCIRMYMRDAEYLFDRIEIGTPVVIR